MAEVIVYTSSTCPYCTAAKDYLDGKGVSYIEKNVSIDGNAARELTAQGYRGVPVIIVNGEAIVGFDRPKLEQLL